VTVRPEPHRLAFTGGALAMVLHLPDTPGPSPCVVACHGLGASKDSDKYLLLGTEFARAGIALARFDFRGCGESTGVEEDTTVATRLADARRVLGALAEDRRLGGGRGLLGSSMGGYVALHLAAEGGGGWPVVTWNAPASLAGLSESERHDGRGLGIAFFEELAAGRYTESPAGLPWHLVIQGGADDVVPVEHGALLHARAAQPCDMLLIEGADHRLSDPGHRMRAVEASLAWFRRFLPEQTPAGRGGVHRRAAESS
jgi:fermentation-respiration switch protein FrsA (DUF1100 family)